MGGILWAGLFENPWKPDSPCPSGFLPYGLVRGRVSWADFFETPENLIRLAGQVFSPMAFLGVGSCVLAPSSVAELELDFCSTCLQSLAFPHHTVSCMHFSGPAAHSTPLWPRQLVGASGMPSMLWHVILLGTTHQHWFSCSHQPWLSFSQQIRENDQWDVPGGDCAADPDRLDQAGSPLPRPDFRTSPDQGHLWNQVLVSDWKVTHGQFHLLDVKGPILGHAAVSPGSSRFEI